jgi:hypothetical protein
VVNGRTAENLDQALQFWYRIHGLPPEGKAMVKVLERRGRNRPPDPRCPECFAKENVSAVARTEWLVCFHCNACGRDWLLRKPLSLQQSMN